MVDHHGGPQGAPRDWAGGLQASLQRAQGHTSPCAAVPVPTAEPGPPTGPAAGPGTYSEAPSGDARTWEEDVLPLVTAKSSPTARGRHGVACDWGNQQPQNREAEPQAVGASLPPAPHWQGRVQGALSNPKPLGNWGHGGLQGLFQAAVAAKPSTALADAASPRHDHIPRDVWGPHPAQLYQSAAPAPPTTACGSCRASTAATCSRQWEEVAVAGRSH